MSARRTLRFAGALCVALSLPTAVAAQGTVEGTVTDAATNQPLVGAQVSVVGLAMGGLTGDAGGFSVGGIPAGTHPVEITYLGYTTERRDITVVDGQTVRLDLALGQSTIGLGGLVVVGTRSRPRTAVRSPVPIDVIPPGEFVNQGDTDLLNLLRNVAPSFNVNTQPISDAATVVRPANLRGLAPDHTLVLVNGKRRHRSSVITWLGNGIADGAQGPDISTIPSIALRQVEILRDGASAQYGSDAIAGVMNFILKDASSGGSVEVKGGGYAEGDGESYTIAGNVGLPLGETGYANFSGEYGNQNSTIRSVQRDDALRLIAAGNTHVRDPAQIWGSPDVENDVKLWGNFGHFFSDRVQGYAHANYASKKVTGGFYFRNPNTRGAVFSGDGGETLLVGDLIDARDGVLDGSANCPVVAITDNVPDPTALRQVMANPDCFSFQELFPGGFTPWFGGDITDKSTVVGLKGRTEGGLSWDVSGSYGSHLGDFFIYNTVNASLGPETPTEFDPGFYRQVERNFNVDLSYDPTDLVSVAWGVELRNEGFEIGIGQEESWTRGPLAEQGFSAASNGFPGFSPVAAGSWNRNSLAIYGDLEYGPGDSWMVSAAVRGADFSGFGSTVNGKVSGRLGLSDALALRGSASTGFRAPTPGQQNAFNVSTIFDFDLMDLVNDGTIPSTSAAAKLYGGDVLEPETSVNLAIGAVIDQGAFKFSTDYFQIDISDRLALTRKFKLTPQQVEDLLAEGITSARNLASFRFFTNDFNTRTRGVDLVATYSAPMGSGVTTFNFAFNHTRTEVTDWDAEVTTEGRIQAIEEGLPRTRFNVSMDHELVSGLRLLGRVSHFDGYYDTEDGAEYSGAQLLDLEAAYPLGDNLRVTVGAQNALNKFPGDNPNAGSLGNKYGQFSPFGFNGGFYYLRLNYGW